jgi:hypothetical protein
MIKQTEPHRAVVETDLQVVEQAIKDHELFQRHLFTLQRVLVEVGPLDVAAIRRGAEAERARLNEVSKQADAAQEQLDRLQKDIVAKQRELAEVEVTIKERIKEGERYNSACQNLRALLAAA